MIEVDDFYKRSVIYDYSPTEIIKLYYKMCYTSMINSPNFDQTLFKIGAIIFY